MSLKEKIMQLRHRGKEEEEVIPPTDVKLYILAEVRKLGIVNYLRTKDIEVSLITEEASSIIDIVLQEEHGARLIIIDYGRGTFSNTVHVEEVLSLIEAFQDIGNVLVLSNTRNFTSQVRRIFKGSDKVEVHSYSGAVGLYKVLKEKNEVYTIGGATEVLVENALEFKAKETGIRTTRARWIESHEDSFKVQEDEEQTEGLPAY